MAGERGDDGGVNRGALAGITVLDLSSGVAGAYCGHLLATYGARVVLVEPPGGSVLRSVGPFAKDTTAREGGAAFLALAAGKESLTLDGDDGRGRDLMDLLLTKADVLLRDGRPEGCDEPAWEALHTRFPRLVLGESSPFGSTGPYAGYDALPGALYALGGYSYTTGDGRREPLQGPENIPGYMAGATLYAGVLAALFARARSGAGQRVEVSELEALAAAHQWTITRYAYNGRIMPRNGNRYDSLHPTTYYACADGTVAVAPSSPDQLDRMMLLLGREELIEDPRFSTNAARMANADAFDAEVAPWFMARTRAEITEACQAYRVPVAPALEVDELLTHEQLVARRFWHDEEQPGIGTVTLPGPPFRMAASAAMVGRAPLPGEHSAAVLAGLAGVDDETFRGLRKDGVV